HALPRPVEHGDAVHLVLALAHVCHDQRAAEPLPQEHRLLERRVGAGAAVQAHQQAREHGYGNTANDSRSCSGNANSSPVIGSLPCSASSRATVSSRSATTTYSVPRRRSATRRRSRTACSSASSASGVRLVYSGIVLVPRRRIIAPRSGPPRRPPRGRCPPPPAPPRVPAPPPTPPP